MKPPSRDPARPPTLISLGGLPGTGKTTIARELARGLAAVYLQVDWIEQTMRSAGWPVEGEGYCVAHAVAEDNLRLGRTVVADSINPWPQSRADWRAVAVRIGVAMLDVEVVCSDAQEHRRRVTTRGADPASQTRTTWRNVADRDYCAWDGERIVVDTARLTVEQCVSAILAEMLAGNQPAPGTGCASTL
jgi:predicted kinase